MTTMEPLIDPVCACLDDYLDGEMSGDEAVHFETHLHHCTVCREAVAQQRWINGTLQDGAAATPAPDVLLVVVSREISQERRRRRRRVLAGGLAAAASVAFIATWAWHRHHQY